MMEGLRRWKIYDYPCLDSTNQRAAQLAREGAGPGTVVLAARQQVGMGRSGRPWYSPPGGLWLSILLEPPLPTGSLPRVNLIAAAAGVRAIGRVAPGAPALIRWPNDMMLRHRKVGGIMTRSLVISPQRRMVILGIGINVNVSTFPPELEGSATSLEREYGRSFALGPVLAHLFRELEELYDLGIADMAELVWRVQPLVYLWGELVRVQVSGGEVCGTLQGLNEAGDVTLRLASGLEITLTPEEGPVHVEATGPGVESHELGD